MLKYNYILGRFQNGLYRFYHEIVHNTELDKRVLDKLISTCLLTIEDRAEIVNHPKQTDRNIKLLDILTERTDNAVQELLAVLKTEDPIYCNLVQKMEQYLCTEPISEAPFREIDEPQTEQHLFGKLI